MPIIRDPDFVQHDKAKGFYLIFSLDYRKFKYAELATTGSFLLSNIRSSENFYWITVIEKKS